MILRRLVSAAALLACAASAPAQISPGVLADPPRIGRMPPVRPLSELPPVRVNGLAVHPAFLLQARDYVFCQAAFCGGDTKVGIHQSQTMQMWYWIYSPDGSASELGKGPMQVDVSPTKDFSFQLWGATLSFIVAPDRMMGWNYPATHLTAAQMDMYTTPGNIRTLYVRLRQGDKVSNTLEVRVYEDPPA